MGASRFALVVSQAPPRKIIMIFLGDSPCAPYATKLTSGPITVNPSARPRRGGLKVPVTCQGITTTERHDCMTGCIQYHVQLRWRRRID